MKKEKVGGVGRGSEDAEIEIPRPLERLTDEEIERKGNIIRVTSEVLHYLTADFLKNGFEWMLPVVLSRSTDPLWPDPGASIEKRVEVEVYETTVRATLSMIIHKMVACSLVHPKLFFLSPNVRIERRDRATTGSHIYEFTQLDFEMREASASDVQRRVEGALVDLMEHLPDTVREELTTLGRSESLRRPRVPFEVYDKESLVSEYGDEWDRRLTEDISEPVWVTNIPREFYDYEDLDEGRWDNYDLFLPGHGEVLSGARREWEYEKLRGKMERDGVDPGSYELLLRLAEEGRLKPSAGGGIGLERLIGWLVGADHIAEVQPFPKVPGIVHDL